MYFGHTSPGYRFAKTGEFQILNSQRGWIRADSMASNYERVYSTAYRILRAHLRSEQIADSVARMIARRNYEACKAKVSR